MIPQAVSFRKGNLVLLDQRQLPDRLTYVHIKTARRAAKAIKDMIVRGAPAIGVAAAYGMVLGRKNLSKASVMLLRSRPTAVNLKWAVERMLDKGSDKLSILLQEAKKIDEENKYLCGKLSLYGSTLIKPGSVVMTHCNAGPLATSAIGTALGVIYKSRKKIKMVYVKETRPRLQGARLTAWELKQWKIPCRLITDGMSAFIMKNLKLDAVITGADRIAANGDTANKIGSYSLAVDAKYHKIPFYIAAPYSTIDFKSGSGTDIEIEERPEDEVLKINGKSISATGIKAFNPGFDVTPAALITSIITEKGIIKTPDKRKLQRLYGK